MKNNIARILLFNIVFFIVLLELVFSSYYFFKDGKYLSVKEKIELNNQNALFEANKVHCKKSNKFGEHPYLAYVHVSVPECDYLVNNTGHRGVDFPIEKDDSKFVVLFTGGSAALQLANMAVPSLGERLKNAFRIPGKEVIFLNGAMEGWKQPQQMILILQNLSVVDMVIAYEGFNEITISRQSDYKMDLDVPALGLYRKARLNREASGQPWGNSFYQVYQTWLYENILLSHSKAAYFFGDFLRQHLNYLADQSAEAYLQEKLPGIYVLPESWPIEKRRDHLIEKYKSYVESIQAATAARGVKYFHFIQPVPALGKNLTDAEKREAADISYDQDYALLEKSLLELRDKGVNVISLTNIFADTSERVYKDAVHLRMETEAPQQVMDKIIEHLK